MKTIRQVAQLSLKRSLLLLALTAYPAYAQTNQERSGSGSMEAALRDPHPVFDLAGYLRADLPSLFVMPGLENPVLQALNARPLGGDQFEADLTAPDGSVLTVQFGLQRVQLPATFLQGDDGPTLVQDARVYKNAKCTLVENPLTIGCGPYRDGNSATLEYLPRKKCKSGTEFCVETSVVYWIRKVYEDNQCLRLIQIDTGKDFMC